VTNPIAADITGKPNKTHTKEHKNTCTIKIKILHKKTATNNMNAIRGITSKSETVENNKN
jgi:hypothetical protein